MKMNRKGLTLIELIIVLVIIAITAALTIPNMGAWIASYRLRTAARDIVSTLRTAQMRAVSHNVEYRVAITGRTYVLQRNSGGGNWVNEGETKTLPPGITITSNTFLNPNSNPLFRPNSSSNGGTIVLANTQNTTRTITVLPSTGRITIQ